jgi:DNA-directed RNA polymerase subunit L
MNISVVEKTKKRMLLKIEGADHTICNIVKTELYGDEAVHAASYTIEHPLIGIPTLLIETDGSKTPEKALQAALKRIEKKNEQFLEQWKKVKFN